MKKKYNELQTSRQARSRDQSTKIQLGLRYIGLVYVRDDWRAEPKELYVGSDSSYFVKHAAGDYRVMEATEPSDVKSNISNSDFNLIMASVTQ